MSSEPSKPAPPRQFVLIAGCPSIESTLERGRSTSLFKNNADVGAAEATDVVESYLGLGRQS